MEEYPIGTVPETPNWSENFAFAGFDPRADIELFCHIGRWRRDLSLWREIVNVALPDGTIAVHRGIGNALATPSGPGGGNYSVEVVDAEKGVFRLRFHGPAKRVTEASMATDMLHEDAQYPLQFDMTFEAIAPVWDLGKVGHQSQFMGAGHVEQFGRLRGAILFDSHRYSYDSVINRDHSRGVRVVDSNLRHNWLQGYLEDGVMFQLYEAEISYDGPPAYAEANVVVNGVAHAAGAEILDKLPFSDNRGLIRAPVRIRIAYAETVFVVTATAFPRTISLQSTGPNDLYPGRLCADDISHSGVLEQAVLYRTEDGRSGYGHMERLMPGRLFQERP